MPPGRGPNSHPIPEFPDPGLIDALAQKWLDEGIGLNALAGAVHNSMAEMNQWRGDAYHAAVTAMLNVEMVVHANADNATKFGTALQQYADQVRQAIKAAKVDLIAEIFGLVFTVATFGFGGLLMAAIVKIAEVIASVGLSIETATFLAGSSVFVPINVGTDVFSQTLGDLIANIPVKIDPTMLPLHVAFGLAA